MRFVHPMGLGSTSYKLYNPYKWPYKRVTGVYNPSYRGYNSTYRLIEVITLVIPFIRPLVGVVYNSTS